MFQHILPVLALVPLLVLAAVGCTQQRVIVANAEPSLKAQKELSTAQRLDVAVVVFDPGLPEDSEKTPVSYALRKAEARYMAFTLRRTLDETGFWGAVRVVPEPLEATDLTVIGRIR